MLEIELNALIKLRHALHRAPELSGGEVKTAQQITSFLDRLSPDELIQNLGGHGLAAIYDSHKEGPTLLIRCELDGLSIVEQSDKPYRSQNYGKAHLCGHDGHMAIVCALAMMLQKQRPKEGRIILLFQPAEETGAGAMAVLSDPQFSRIRPDYAFAVHNVPGYALGDVYLKSGPVTCASRGMRVRFGGKTSHASQPEDGVSPISAMMAFMSAVTSMCCGDAGDTDFVLTTIVHAWLGEAAFGIAPGDGEVWITLRTTNSERMERLVKACEQLARELAADAGLNQSVSYCDVFPACTNDPEATDIVAAAALLENINCRALEAPMRWSEDFGAFGSHCKAAMFFIGSGENHAQLHNPDFDFPDELIEPCARMFKRIISLVLE